MELSTIVLTVTSAAMVFAICEIAKLHKLLNQSLALNKDMIEAYQDLTVRCKVLEKLEG
jgi:hypothetical protein